MSSMLMKLWGLLKAAMFTSAGEMRMRKGKGRYPNGASRIEINDVVEKIGRLGARPQSDEGEGGTGRDL